MRAWKSCVLAAVAAGLAWSPVQAQPQQIVSPSLEKIEQLFPSCAGMLRQADVDTLAKAGSDPLERFEAARRARLSLIEAPPTTACRSKIWRHLHSAAPEQARSVFEPDIEGFDAPYSNLFNKSGSASANSPAAGGVTEYQGEVQVAVNANNTLQMVAGANSFYRDPAAACQAPIGASKTYGTQALYGSTDGGKTWVYHCAPWPATLTGGVSGADAWFGSDPALAWDGNGNAYAVYMLLSLNSTTNAAGAAIVVAKSTDVGQTWTPLGVVVDHITSSSAFDDKEMVAIDTSNGVYSHPGRMYVIWDENNVERVAYSDDGVAWTTKILSTPLYSVGADVKVGPDGTVYAVWNRVYLPNNLGQAQGDDTYFSKSTDGGATWTAPVKIFTHTLASFQTYYKPAAQNERGVNSFPSLDIDRNPSSPFFGRLYIAYADTTLTFGQIDVYARTSSNGGTTWSNRLKVNDDTAGVTHIFPWLGVDPTDGTVNVAWYDTRNDSVDQERTQIFYARSSNGGTSFEPNVNLTDSGAKFSNQVAYSDEDSWSNLNMNPNQYGDYLGVAAINRKVQVVWTDSRQFYPSFTTNTKVEDFATVTFTNCSSPRVSVPSVTQTVSGVSVSWGIQTWGTNATSGTFGLDRFSNGTCSGQATHVGSYFGSTFSASDAPPAGGTYTYKITATNNCPGTALTKMAASSCSAPFSY
jgi:hypothetical protein